MGSLSNVVVSVLMNVLIGGLLLFYLPVSWAWKMAKWAFQLRPAMEDMRGKVVLITGASSGIGEELAYQYARRGASLALVARRVQALEAVVMKARENGTPEAIIIPADISSESESKRVIEETISHFGKLNHLVVNAGIWSSCLFEEITDITGFTQMMDVNFWGSVFPTYHAIPHLKKSQGKIIVNASMAGRLPFARMSFYTATKAAMIRFYEVLRAELSPNVGITIVCLGFVASEITRGKALQTHGEVAVNEEARDIQIGMFPIVGTEECAKVMVEGACRGDKYLTWPCWYQPFHMLMCLAPEIIDFISRSLYVSKSGEDSRKTLSKKLLDFTGADKFLRPASFQSPPAAAGTKMD